MPSTSNYTITDTGAYLITAYATLGSGCTSLVGSGMIIHVGYAIAAGVFAIADSELQVYPSVSSGIFHIRSSENFHPTLISVTDEEGKIIYTSFTAFSEINLSHFTEGIYFYAIENESHRIFRGRIIKN
jgi:hypothetical protein